MCSNEDVNWDLACLPRMHSQPGLSVLDHTRMSVGKFLVATSILYICVYLDESGLLHPVTTCHNCSVCVTNHDRHASPCHELWSGDWRETLTLIWSTIWQLRWAETMACWPDPPAVARAQVLTYRVSVSMCRYRDNVEPEIKQTWPIEIFQVSVTRKSGLMYYLLNLYIDCTLYVI